MPGTLPASVPGASRPGRWFAAVVKGYIPPDFGLPGNFSTLADLKAIG